jgi:hypothetical protein
LRAAGVEVELATGDIARRARHQNAGFRTLVLLGAPARHLQGRRQRRRPRGCPRRRAALDLLAAEPGAGARVAGAVGRRRGRHRHRACRRSDPDRPRLRASAERQPLRVVFDRAARLPVGSALVRSVGEGPVAVVCRPGRPGSRPVAAALRRSRRRRRPGAGRAGAPWRGDDAAGGRPHPRRGTRGRGLVDRLALFVAPLVLGAGRTRWRAGPPCGWARGARAEQPPVGPDTLLVADVHEV